jgi:nucleoside-diphosphate-sugar epimerase
VSAVAVTGADGFVGRQLCVALEKSGFKVVRVVRRVDGPGSVRQYVSNLSNISELEDAFRGVDVVVHLAALAHVTSKSSAELTQSLNSTNVVGTDGVARAVVRAGVPHFIYLSSIGVNGNTTHGKPFSESDQPAPVEEYAKSKLRAEQLLQTFAATRSFDLTIVRPPLIYGPGAPGNFARFMQLARRNWPLPLASIENQRHFIGLQNLCEFLTLCISHPRARNQTFLVAEPQAYSTPELYGNISLMMNRRSLLFSCPPRLLQFGATLVGKSAEFQKLVGSLEISIQKIQSIFRWYPQISFETEMKRTVEHFLKTQHDA